MCEETECIYLYLHLQRLAILKLHILRDGSKNMIHKPEINFLSYSVQVNWNTNRPSNVTSSGSSIMCFCVDIENKIYFY